MKFIFTILVLLSAGLSVGSELVVKVSDGDTIWTKDESGRKKKIRMVKIDAPESNHPFEIQFGLMNGVR